MIVVHMGDHDITYRPGLHAQGAEALGDRPQQRAPAFRSRGSIKSGVDHNGAFIRADDPHVVVQRHGLRVVIPAQEVQVTEPLKMAVAHGINAIAHAEARTPPSTCRMSPLMKDAASLNRNRDALVASSSRPSRRSGMVTARRSYSACGVIATAPGVGMEPGASALTRTLRGPSSAARVRVKVPMAPFTML